MVAAAVAFAKEQVGKPPRRIGEKKIDKASIPAGLFEKARGVARPPPERADRAQGGHRCRRGGDRRCRIAEGNARERQVFREAAASPYARALQYAFFAERQAANLPGIGPDTKLRDIKTVGILGAGTMGTGITLAFLNAGFPVTIVETTQEALDAGVDRIKDTLSANAKRGRITEAQAADRFAKLTPVAEDGGPRQGRPHHRGRVREHGAEEGDLRQARQNRQVGRHHRHQHLHARRRRDRRRRPSGRRTWWACTSSRPPTSCGCWRSCAPRRPANDVMATVDGASPRSIGKVGVQAGVCDGFVGNRMLAAYGGEVQAMTLEGAMPQEIDGALEAWGMAMGPLAVSDLAGLDVGYRIRKERKLTGEAAQFARVPDKIVEMGRHGQKTGAGYYKYDDNRKRQRRSRDRGADPRRGRGAADQAAPHPRRRDRRALPAAARQRGRQDPGGGHRAPRQRHATSCTSTATASRPGAAARCGRPTIMGLKKVAERIKAYEAKYGARWKIAPLIEKLAAEGGTFAALDAKKK